MSGSGRVNPGRPSEAGFRTKTGLQPTISGTETLTREVIAILIPIFVVWTQLGLGD